MILQENRWVRNGITIGTESVRLLFRHPILFAYALIPMLTVVFMYLFMDPTYAFIKQNLVGAELDSFSSAQLAAIGTMAIVTMACDTFFASCLARHAMHILRNQPASIRESCTWIMQHSRQIVTWMVAEIFFSLSWLTFAHPVMAAIGALCAMIGSLFVLGLLSTVLFFLKIHIMVPIIANETITLIPAIKRSSQVIWSRFGTYIVAMLWSSVLAALLFALPAIIINLLFWQFAHSAEYPKFLQWSIFLALPVITLVKTIFYHEFYVKRAVESVEELFTQQR
ncbi:hypothetical protein JST99_02290 [Candidatus Dependentiae bacterium]|nr:hypothetical protein [Candidatus Dependentiae bacterium]MCC7415448.1 hypothetical protein [Campylobacterota bacterium]